MDRRDREEKKADKKNDMMPKRTLILSPPPKVGCTTLVVGRKRPEPGTDANRRMHGGCIHGNQPGQ